MSDNESALDAMKAFAKLVGKFRDKRYVALDDGTRVRTPEYERYLKRKKAIFEDHGLYGGSTGQERRVKSVTRAMLEEAIKQYG